MSKDKKQIKTADNSSVMKPVNINVDSAPSKAVAKPLLPLSLISLKNEVPKANTVSASTSLNKKVGKKPEKKKAKLDIPQTNDPYFVYLRNPLEYRRQILESSRKILYCLKNHQKIIIIRQKKLEQVKNLKICIRELLYLDKKFNEKLPKYNIPILRATVAQEKQLISQQKSTVRRTPVSVAPQKTELEKLEDSLANIEKKLRSLQ